MCCVCSLIYVLVQEELVWSCMHFDTCGSVKREDSGVEGAGRAMCWEGHGGLSRIVYQTHVCFSGSYWPLPVYSPIARQVRF